MSPSSKGGRNTLPSDISGSEAHGKASEPIGRLAEYQIFTPTFRRGEPQSWEEWQIGTVCPTSPKKRKSDSDEAVRVPKETLLQVIEDAVAKAFRGSVAPTAGGGSPEDVQSFRSEMHNNISKVQTQLTQLLNNAMEKMQAEADKRADAMFQRLVQMLKGAPRNDIDKAMPSLRADVALGCAAQISSRQGPQQPTRAAQPTWAEVTGMGAKTATDWTTVTNGKKKLKKHPLDQRRILFTRNSQSHACDPRDIMFEVNKALAHARAHVAVRLINLRYTEKGNLSGVMRENACAEDLLEFATAVMSTMQKLDPAVINVEKTEKWRKLRVHGVALDRYMSEGGLDVAREEIELMTGEQLPYAPRWIKAETLGERFDSGTIKRSTLVLTVKSKQAADAILAKGLSFGGRRHEAERFWERGEGRMCMHCCGRDHFGKCVEKAKCFVCADEHEGAKHKCNAEGCSKKTEPCEHHAAKCANCEGPHMATSRRCPEKRSNRQTDVRKPTDMRSSPPTMDTELDEDDLPTQGGQMEMDATPPESERTTEPDAIETSSNIDVHPTRLRDQSLPRVVKGARSSTEFFTGPTQPHSSSDQTHMSIDDDSASA